MFVNADGIFFVDGGTLRPLMNTPYENEDLLQRALVDFPEVLAGRVTASEDQTARVWHVGWKELVALLRSRTTACLTSEQRIRYLIEVRKDATANYEACERRYGRLPEASASP